MSAAAAPRSQYWAGQPQWFEIEEGMVFEVLRHGPIGSRWVVEDPRYDGSGTARVARLDDEGKPTDERDTVWWAELFADSRLVTDLLTTQEGSGG